MADSTGEISPVVGTPLDFRQPIRIGDRIEQLTDTGAKGYDHNYVLNSFRDDESQHLVASLTGPKSGRVLTIFSTEPGVQLYSGNFLLGQQGKNGKTYPYRSALCLETQHFPDSVNHEDFPATILQPDETFKSTTTYRFSVQE